MNESACVDCHVDTTSHGIGEYYMVRFDVWAASGLEPDGGHLCVGCLELRLGRRLLPLDFIDAPVNDLSWGRKSARLLDRLGPRSATWLLPGEVVNPNDNRPKPRDVRWGEFVS